MSRIPPLPRTPNALLGLLSVVCFAGPMAVWLALRGGASPDWPPDRGVEWAAFAAVVGVGAGLFVACVTIGWWYPWPGRAGGRRDR